MQKITRQEINEAADIYADSVTGQFDSLPLSEKIGDEFIQLQTYLMRRAFVHGMVTAFEANGIPYEDPLSEPILKVSPK